MSFLHVNEWQGERWFNKEQAEYLFLLITASKIQVNAGTTDDKNARLYDIRFYFSLYESIFEKLKLSSDSVDRLLKIVKSELGLQQ